jgi:hypothetical protein
MKHFEELDSIETEIIRLGELKNLYALISNGAESSDKEQIISSIQYVEGSLEDIQSNLAYKYQVLFNAISNVSPKDEE